MDALEGDGRAAEEKDYLRATDGNEGLIELLIGSKDTFVCLEACFT